MTVLIVKVDKGDGSNKVSIVGPKTTIIIGDGQKMKERKCS